MTPDALHRAFAFGGKLCGRSVNATWTNRCGEKSPATPGLVVGNRPVAEIASGKRYHFHHMGFNYRRLRERPAAEFRLRRIAGGPVRLLGALSNPETWFVVSKKPWLSSRA